MEQLAPALIFFPKDGVKKTSVFLLCSISFILMTLLFFFFFNIYVLIWLHQVVVAAGGLLRFGLPAS